MIGRLVRSADFERVLRSPARARSVHFAVHHVRACPELPARRLEKAACTELSTSDGQLGCQAVDDSGEANARLWLGMVIPKRHARRAVTRTLLKRQMRACVRAHAERLPSGMWVLRMRSPFERERYPSAASDVLRTAAADELAGLLDRASRTGMA